MVTVATTLCQAEGAHRATNIGALHVARQARESYTATIVGPILTVGCFVKRMTSRTSSTTRQGILSIAAARARFAQIVDRTVRVSHAMVVVLSV